MLLSKCSSKRGQPKPDECPSFGSESPWRRAILTAGRLVVYGWKELSIRLFSCWIRTLHKTSVNEVSWLVSILRKVLHSINSHREYVQVMPSKTHLNCWRFTQNALRMFCLALYSSTSKEPLTYTSLMLTINIPLLLYILSWLNCKWLHGP